MGLHPPVTSARWDVLGLGAVSVDDLVYVDHHPLADAKMPIRDWERQGGGLAGTALVAAARLGARAAYCGALDDDELSQFTIAELERERVDCAPVLRLEGARPFHSLIVVDRSSGGRSILYSGAGVREVPLEHVSAGLVGSARVLFVDHTALASGLRAARQAHSLGIPVVGDVEAGEGVQLHEFLEAIDHLIVGLQWAGQATGCEDPRDMVSALASHRVCTVVTAGARGAWYSLGGGPVCHTPAFAVPVVDTTGCGDVFHGAYAAAIARGEPPPAAIRSAAAAAALKAMRPGGRAGTPDRETLERFLAAHPRDP